MRAWIPRIRSLSCEHELFLRSLYGRNHIEDGGRAVKQQKVLNYMGRNAKNKKWIIYLDSVPEDEAARDDLKTTRSMGETVKSRAPRSARRGKRCCSACR